MRKHHDSIKFIGLCTIFAFFPDIALAEIIILNSGKKLEGTIIQTTDTGAVIRTSQGDFDVRYRMMASVEPSAKDNAALNPNIKVVTGKINSINQLRQQKAAEETKRIYSKRVEFYMTSWCPYCQKMEMFLKKNKIQYKKFNIEYDAKAQKKFLELGGRGVPLVRVEDRIISGYNPQAVLNELTR